MCIAYIHFMFFCDNHALYQRLSKKHRTSEWHVYRVAHGKPIRSLREGCIYRDLHKEGFFR